jgi:glycosyltransferase involved in cell wall biosynthesis
LPVRAAARNVVLVGNMEPFLYRRYRYSPDTRLRNWLLHRASVAAVRRAERTIACSRFVEEHLGGIPGVDRQRLYRIYHGRDRDFPGLWQRERPSLPVQSPFFLTCGSLLPYRRCEDVIQAFTRFAKSPGRESFSLVIAGTGTDRRYSRLLQEEASASGLGDRICFAGHVDRPIMSGLYSQCAACILATEIEACPITAIEALSCGCRIVAGSSPPMPEMLGDAALWFQPRAIEEMAARMAEAVDGPASNDLPARARARAEAFDWDECAKKTFQVLVDWS